MYHTLFWLNFLLKLKCVFVVGTITNMYKINQVFAWKEIFFPCASVWASIYKTESCTFLLSVRCFNTNDKTIHIYGTVGCWNKYVEVHWFSSSDYLYTFWQDQYIGMVITLHDKISFQFQNVQVFCLSMLSFWIHLCQNSACFNFNK